MTQTLNSAHEPSGAAHLPQGLSGSDEPATVLRVEGPVPSVEARAASLRQELAGFGAADLLGDEESRGLWRFVRDVGPLTAPQDRTRIVWRVSIAPSAAPGFLATARRALDLRYFLDWGGGLLWLSVANAEDGGARAIRGALGSGHATLIRASDALRASVPVFEPQPAAVAALVERVKDSFDPKRILNRGRIYRGL